MTIISERLMQAISLASYLHKDQVRNDVRKTPYISHLVSVAFLVSSVTSDEDVIIAALMHDSLEDVPHYTYDNLVHDCGKRVADIVSHVTEPLDANKGIHEQLPWLSRKEIYLKRLEEGGVESAIVSCADKIHNTESFLYDFHHEGESFSSRFTSSLTNRIWFHQEVITRVTAHLGETHPLVIRLVQGTQQLEVLQ